MKVITLLLILLSFISCRKEIFNNIEGYYNVTGIQVNCSYYYCDTVNYNNVIWVWEKPRVNNDNPDKFVFRQYDSLKNEFVSFSSPYFTSIEKDWVIFGEGFSRRVQARINHKDGRFEYTVFGGNGDAPKEDTLTTYYILKGVKQ